MLKKVFLSVDVNGRSEWAVMETGGVGWRLMAVLIFRCAGTRKSVTWLAQPSQYEEHDSDNDVVARSHSPRIPDGIVQNQVKVMHLDA